MDVNPFYKRLRSFHHLLPSMSSTPTANPHLRVGRGSLHVGGRAPRGAGHERAQTDEQPRGLPATRGGINIRGRGQEGIWNRDKVAKARPTHFLAIPLGTHSILRKRISSFTDALLNGVPAIAGLDSTVIVDPRRMHFTLGVMALNDHSELTVSAALELLNSLKADILQILNGSADADGEPLSQKSLPLRIPLDTLGILKPENEGGGNVLWVGPDVSSITRGKGKGKDFPPTMSGDVARLVRVTDLIHRVFRERGFIVDTRPLKLHCTLVNTSYRRPRARIPFAYDAILRSNALKDISVVSSAALPSSHTQLDASSHAGAPPAGDIQRQTDRNEPPARNTPHILARDELVKVNLGTWTAKEIQLCVMGSHGPENEYVSVGRIRLDAA